MLVVDDSVVVRRLVTSVLESDPGIRVAGTAANGSIALSKVQQLAPDAVTLDVEMPVMDGLATLKALRRTHPRLPVVMFSTLTERAATATLDALALGASDYVTKPANVGSVQAGMASVRDQLIPKIKALCGQRAAPAAVAAPAPAVPHPAAPAGDLPARVDVLAVGASTGGPDALAALLPQLPADLPVPVVVTQHMPPVFTRLFAQRLDTASALAVKEAEDGDVLQPGLVLLAPGDRHLDLEAAGGQVRVRLSTAPPENYCRPAVDVMFRAVASAYGGRVLAVVLTGMGQDGARGADVLRRAGAEVLVQDAATSVVWGMPGAVATAGLAHRVLPLPAVAADVVSVLRRGRAPQRLTAGSAT